MDTERSKYINGQKIYDHAAVALYRSDSPIFVSMCDPNGCLYISPDNAKKYLEMGNKGQFSEISDIATGKTLKDTVGMLNKPYIVDGVRYRVKDVLLSPTRRQDALISAVNTIVTYTSNPENGTVTVDSKHTTDLLNAIDTLNIQCQRQINGDVKLRGQTTDIDKSNPLIRAAELLLIAKGIKTNQAINHRVEQSQHIDGSSVASLIKAAQRRGIDPVTVWEQTASNQPRRGAHIRESSRKAMK